MRYVELAEFAETIKARLHNRADCPMVITGLPGTGKTTFSIHLGIRVDPEFSVRRNVIFDPSAKKIYAKITKELPPFSAPILDEGIRALNRRKAMDSLNVFLMEYFAICRKEYKFIPINLPSIHQIDRTILNDRAIYWVDIVKRGLGVIFTRKKHSSAEDPFGVKKNLIDRAIAAKFPGRSSMELTYDEIVYACSTIKDHFVGAIRFPALPPAIEKEYEEAAAEMRQEIKLPEDWGSRAKLQKMRLNRLVYYMKQEHEVTQQDLADIMQCDQQYVSRCLQEEEKSRKKLQ